MFISLFCWRLCLHYDLSPKHTIKWTSFVWRSINIHNKSKVRGLSISQVLISVYEEHGGLCSLLTCCHIVEALSTLRRISVMHRNTVLHTHVAFSIVNLKMYEGWNFNFGNAALTFDTAHLQSSYFHRPSMYSPKLCRTSSQRWGSRMMPLAAPLLLMVRTERSTAEGLTPPCNCPIP